MVYEPWQLVDLFFTTDSYALHCLLAYEFETKNKSIWLNFEVYIWTPDLIFDLRVSSIALSHLYNCLKKKNFMPNCDISNVDIIHLSYWSCKMILTMCMPSWNTSNAEHNSMSYWSCKMISLIWQVHYWTLLFCL